MYYHVKTTSGRIIHTEACFHIQNTAKENLIVFDSVLDACSHGYRFCKHCNPIAPLYIAEEQQILDYSRTNGISVHLGSRFIVVSSPRSRWLITLDKRNRLALFHKNTINRSCATEPEIKGYHRQKDVQKETIQEYLVYIVEHDYFRMCNPIWEKPKQEPARKGTKRYRKHMKQAKKLEKKQKVRNVIQLLASIHT